MSTPICVSGVLGLCCAGIAGSTRVRVALTVPCTGSVVGVLGLLSRTHRRDGFGGFIGDSDKSYANTEKLNKPNTLNTTTSNPLNLLSFNRVGYVLGSLNVCWVVHEGATNDE
ncbi:hypothetical protein D3C76_1166610 [compost metagenome]